jgi:hypothetical protein
MDFLAHFGDFSVLTSVKGARITNIGTFAFQGCTALTELSFPLVQTIGNLAFYGCTGLTAIELPATEIGINAFWGCTGLETVKLPSATTINSSAFQGCTDLITVTIGFGCNITSASSFPNGFTGYYNGNSKAAGTYTWDGSVWGFTP